MNIVANSGGTLVSLASGVLPEFSPQATASAAAAAGFKAVGLWVEPDDWTDRTSREVARIVADGGLRVLDAEVVWIKPGPLDPKLLRILDIAAQIGAANVLVVSSDPDRDATAEKLGRLVDHASPSGVRVSLEFGAFTAVRDLSAALEVLERTGRAQAGLLVDPLHLARTGGRPRDMAGVAASRFVYAQFCDAPAVGADPDDVEAIIHEAIDLRLLPGEGALPLRALLDALPPGTPLSIEVRSRALRETYPDPAERARAVLAATESLLAKFAA